MLACGLRALAGTLSKADFAEMRIIGQFNLGFILVRDMSAAVVGDSASLFVDAARQ